MLISHRPHVRTLTFALTALAALAVLLGLVVAAVLRNGDTVRHHPSFPTPDPPAQDRFHFSDLLAPAADGTPLVAGLSPRSGQTEIGKLAAALSVVADPDDYGTARRLLSDEVDRAVASFAGGSDADAPVLAKLFLLDRWTNRGLVGEKVVQAIADQLDRSGSASAWNAEVAATIWLRSEVAERLLARGDRARADRLAAIDSTLACPLAEHAAEDAASTAVVLAYTARHGDLAC